MNKPGFFRRHYWTLLGTAAVLAASTLALYQRTWANPEESALEEFSGRRPVAAAVNEPASEPAPIVKEPTAAALQTAMQNYSDFNFPSELDLIEYTSERIGADLDLMLAIREAEKGRDGLQFGIMPTKAYKKNKTLRERDGTRRPYSSELEKQASWTACTIRKNMERYNTLPPKERKKYRDFIDFLGDRYCPVGADDPHGLNINWEGNVRSFYRKFSERN